MTRAYFQQRFKQRINAIDKSLFYKCFLNETIRGNNYNKKPENFLNPLKIQKMKIRFYVTKLSHFAANNFNNSNIYKHPSQRNF